MDKKLLNALNNLSVALETISDILSKKGDKKSDTSKALSGGDVSKKIEELNKSLKEVIETKKTEQNTLKTISKNINRIEKKIDNISKTKTVGVKEQQRSVEKQGEDGGIFGKSVNPEQAKKIKDGVSMIVLIAAGVLAIGLAFKIIGNVNIGSVISLGLAISIIVIAFSKLAEVENLTPVKASSLGLVLVSVSIAIMASSFILSLVRPIGITQLFTTVLIAGMFTAISYGLANLLSGISNISAKGLLMLPILPIVLVGISIAIALSSQFLGMVKPIGLFQAITSILIAAVFSTISYGIGGLLTGLSNLNMKSILMIPLLPVIMIAISAAIVGSSYLLGMVKPVGLFQIITSVFIGIVFTAVGYGLGKIIQGLSSVKSLAEATKIAAILPVVMIAISTAIMGSSYLLSIVKPVGLFQLLTAIMIGIAFVPISYAISPIVKAINNITPVKMALVPIIMIAMATTIMASSHILKETAVIGFDKFMTILGLTITLAAIGYGMGFVLDKLSKYQKKDILSGAFNLLIITGVIFAADLILSKGDFTKIIPFGWVLGTGLSILVFGAAIWAMDKFKLDIGKITLGSLSIIIIAGAILATDSILSNGEYSKIISLDWVLGVGASILAFGLIAAGLGFIATLGGGMGAVALAAGLVAILGVALTILGTAEILSKGDFTKYPSLEWSQSVALSLAAFATGMTVLGAIIVGTFGAGAVALAAGSLAVLFVVDTIVLAGEKLSKGKFTGGPKKEWAEGISLALGAFSSVYKMLLDNAGPSFFRSGVTPEEFSKAIVTISKGIKSAAYELGLGESNYKKGPTKEWSEGVSLALGGFAPIYKILVDNAGIWKSGVSVDDFKNAIESISKGIKTAAAELAKGEQEYKKGPTKDWSEGVSTSLQAFTGIFQALGANSSWFTGTLEPEDYQNAIKAVGMGLAEAAKSIGGEGVTYDLNKVPKKEWGQAVSDTFQAFIPAMKYVQEQSGIFSDGGEEITNSMNAISTAIKNTSLTLSDGNYEIIDPSWSFNLKRVFADFTNILNTNKGFTQQSYEKLEKISKSVKNISLVLSSGNYTKTIPDGWSKSVKANLLTFGDMIEKFDSGGILDMFDDSTEEKVKEIVGGIILISELFNNNKVPFDIKKVPSIQWSQGLAITISSITPVLQYMGENDVSDFKDAILGIIDSIVLSSKKLDSGKFDKPLDPKYFKNLKDSTNIYIGITKALEKADMDYDAVTDMADSMIELANAYERLSESLGKLNGQLGSVDMERMTMLKNLTGSIVMVSLLDAVQFENMMSSLESKAKIFVNIMNDTMQSTKESMPMVTPQEVRPGKPQASTSNVKTQKPQEDKNKESIDMLSKSIGRLEGYLAQLTQVIAGTGDSSNVSLKEYLNSNKVKGGLLSGEY